MLEGVISLPPVIVRLFATGRNPLKEKAFIIAHGFRSHSPRSLCSVAVDLYWDIMAAGGPAGDLEVESE